MRQLTLPFLEIAGKATNSKMPSWLNKKVIVSAVAAVLVVVVIVVIAVVATGTTTPPPVPKLKITAKVTFTVSNAGKIDIGIFGDRFPVTAKNFIALAKGKYEGRTLSYQYIRSTFDRVIEDVDEDYYVRGGKVFTSSVFLVASLQPCTFILSQHFQIFYVGTLHRTFRAIEMAGFF